MIAPVPLHWHEGRYIRIAGDGTGIHVQHPARATDDALRRNTQPDDQCEHEEIATLAANAPLSLYANKRTVQAVLQDRADRDIAAINAAMAACFDSEDYKEGVAAFKEKRKANFTGK